MRTTAPEKSSNKSTRTTSPRGKNDELGAAKSGKEKACCCLRKLLEDVFSSWKQRGFHYPNQSCCGFFKVPFSRVVVKNKREENSEIELPKKGPSSETQLKQPSRNSIKTENH